MNDAVQRGPRSYDQSQDTKHDDNNIFHDHSDAFGPRNVVPVSAALDEGRECEPKSGQT